jgi:hypothetical protein
MRPEEVKEDPMKMAKAQEKKKSELFFLPYFDSPIGKRGNRKGTH